MYEINPGCAGTGVYQPAPGTALFEEGLKWGLVKSDMIRDVFSPCRQASESEQGERTE